MACAGIKTRISYILDSKVLNVWPQLETVLRGGHPRGPYRETCRPHLFLPRFSLTGGRSSVLPLQTPANQRLLGKPNRTGLPFWESKLLSDQGPSLAKARHRGPSYYSKVCCCDANRRPRMSMHSPAPHFLPPGYPILAHANYERHTIRS